MAGVVAACESSDVESVRTPVARAGAPDVEADEHFRSGLAAAAEGRSQAALLAFAGALAVDPTRADVLDARASLHLQLGSYAEALGDIERAVDLAPAEPSFRSNRAQVYRQFGRTAEALADLDKALELDPDFFPALFNRGTLFYELNQYEEALVDFDRCVELDPSVAPPYFNRGATQNALGRFEEARRDLTHFLELETQDTWRKAATDLLDQIGEP